MKSANELLTELVRHAQPPSDCAITLTESKPKISGDVNWIAGAGVLDPAALDRYSRKIVDLRKSDMLIDWSAVPGNPNGERKRIEKWHSEVSGN
jgi:hypothetical protein